MDDIIRYAAAMTLGTFSLPLALGLGWLSLRCIFDFMPHRQAAAVATPRALVAANNAAPRAVARRAA